MVREPQKVGNHWCRVNREMYSLMNIYYRWEAEKWVVVAKRCVRTSFIQLIVSIFYCIAALTTTTTEAAHLSISFFNLTSVFTFFTHNPLRHKLWIPSSYSLKVSKSLIHSRSHISLKWEVEFFELTSSVFHLSTVVWDWWHLKRKVLRPSFVNQQFQQFLLFCIRKSCNCIACVPYCFI